MYAFSTGFVT